MLRRIAPLLLLTTACDAMIDGDYRGEVIASLTGEITSSRAAATPGVDVVVDWWEQVNSGGTYVHREKVTVEGEFPIAFRLDLTGPPDLEGGLEEGFYKDGLYGVITVYEAERSDDPVYVSPLGVEEQHALVWVAEENRGTEFPFWFDATSGYHVFDILGLPLEDDEAFEQCTRDTTDPAGDLACRTARGDKMRERYPDIDFSRYDQLTDWQEFDVLSPSSGDLDTLLRIDLKDSDAEIDMPDVVFDWNV